MIKEIVASTLLTTSIGIQNTQITQDTTRKVSMDNQSYWTTTTTQNPQTGLPISIESYRNIQTNNPISNSTFTIKQRILEGYYCTNTPLNRAINEYYLLINIGGANTIELSNISTQIGGSITNAYDIDTCYFTIVKTDYEDIQDQVLIDFLDGDELATKTDYTTTKSHINQFITDNSTRTQNYTMTNETYSDFINEYEIEFTAQDYYTSFLIKIYIEYPETFINDLTITTPYSPFDIYGRQITYNVQWLANVPQSGTGEIIDIPGMMLMVLGMPFTFVAQAFDLTIFPGTYYQVNLAHIALAVLGAGLIIFVFKKFLK